MIPVLVKSSGLKIDWVPQDDKPGGNAMIVYEKTPLFKALSVHDKNNYELIKALIDNGADAKRISHNDKSTIVAYLWEKTINVSKDIVQLLLAEGVDLDVAVQPHDYLATDLIKIKYDLNLDEGGESSKLICNAVKTESTCRGHCKWDSSSCKFVQPPK